MKIEMWNMSDIKPYANDPRINDPAGETVAVSIRAFGFRQPLVVDRHGHLIAGHTRYQAALLLALEFVPIDVATSRRPHPGTKLAHPRLRAVRRID